MDLTIPFAFLILFFSMMFWNPCLCFMQRFIKIGDKSFEDRFLVALVVLGVSLIPTSIVLEIYTWII